MARWHGSQSCSCRSLLVCCDQCTFVLVCDRCSGWRHWSRGVRFLHILEAPPQRTLKPVAPHWAGVRALPKARGRGSVLMGTMGTQVVLCSCFLFFPWNVCSIQHRPQLQCGNKAKALTFKLDFREAGMLWDAWIGVAFSMTVLSSEFGIQGGDNGDASGRSWSTTSVGWSDRKKVSNEMCSAISVCSCWRHDTNTEVIVVHYVQSDCGPYSTKWVECSRDYTFVCQRDAFSPMAGDVKDHVKFMENTPTDAWQNTSSLKSRNECSPSLQLSCES